MVVQRKSRIPQDGLPLSLIAQFHWHATCLGAIRPRHRSAGSTRSGEHYSIFERAPPSQHGELGRVPDELFLLANDRDERLREQAIYEPMSAESSRNHQDNPTPKA